MPRCSLSEKVTSRHSLVESDNTLPVNANNHFLSLEKMQQRRTHWVYFFPIHHESYNADSVEYLMPSLDDDNPHKSFS
ncbi:hypothetical protein N7447_002684 [Penicillium robsamsonii]|uniref:uncharacterized protein n=1 Tax=Penicillium robsamsonii TaxID=1792511 RepID=UPI0025495A6D|nr:uncharacterized protein N7447_002684 [Penicillium robsamsonii]KAJ5836658.1 hypothetical protein N7447_002684 [Penicillium robsamsonii]